MPSSSSAGRESSGSSTAQAGVSTAQTGGSPGQAGAGSDARLPGAQDGSGERDGATGDLNNGQSGTTGSSGGVLGQPDGDYSLDTLPSGTLGGGNRQTAGREDSQSAQQGPQGQQPGGAITTAERAAILDGRLRRGYEDFDGFILGERERAQRESNEAGSVAIGGDTGGGGAGAANQPQTLPAGENENDARPSGVIVSSQPAGSSREQEETFPPPEDIPSGRDDDVVARQIREAAMSEPDPELREALWEEYRRYTGISQGDE